jgi:uncharacterized membrane protein YhhN
MKTRILILLYFTIGLAFIIMAQLGWFIPGLILKSMIMPVLIIFYVVSIRGEFPRFHRFILAGFVFSWAGDILLELAQNNESFFMLGLIGFLLAQVMYLAAFISTPGPNAVFGYLLIPIVLYGFALVFFLYPDLGEMKIPVIVYAVVILSMLAGAVNRLEKVKRQSFFLVLTGAILFVLSDSTIAVNKFSYPFEGARVVIMTLYITGQYLIALGCIRQTESSPA